MILAKLAASLVCVDSKWQNDIFFIYLFSVFYERVEGCWLDVERG
jgi:hypothetical protein